MGVNCLRKNIWRPYLIIVEKMQHDKKTTYFEKMKMLKIVKDVQKMNQILVLKRIKPCKIFIFLISHWIFYILLPILMRLLSKFKKKFSKYCLQIWVATYIGSGIYSNMYKNISVFTVCFWLKCQFISKFSSEVVWIEPSFYSPRNIFKIKFTYVQLKTLFLTFS